jgi:hypothetical protein
MFLTALLCLIAQAAPVPTSSLGSTVDPTSAMNLAVSSGVPFHMAISMPTPLMARSFDWALSAVALVATVPTLTASPPAWAPSVVPSRAQSPLPSWTPPVVSSWAPSPVPSKSPAVTTIVVSPTASTTVPVPAPTPSYTWEKTHDDAKNTHKNILVAVIVGSILVGAALVSFVVYCIHRCIHGKPGIDESMKQAILDVEANRQPRGSDVSEAPLVRQPPMELRDFSTLTAGNGRALQTPAPPARAHWSRGQGMRSV